MAGQGVAGAAGGSQLPETCGSAARSSVREPEGLGLARLKSPLTLSFFELGTTWPAEAGRLQPAWRNLGVPEAGERT
jgi:hypothetical protein